IKWHGGEYFTIQGNGRRKATKLTVRSQQFASSNLFIRIRYVFIAGIFQVFSDAIAKWHSVRGFVTTLVKVILNSSIPTDCYVITDHYWSHSCSYR
ncbi:hypothetical protein V1478_004362, partial [Vespula squamosa]